METTNTFSASHSRALSTSTQEGVLSDQYIRTLASAGRLKDLDDAHIRPASLDLSITSEVYRLEDLFLPKHGESIREILKLAHPTPHHLSHPLERGVTYIARLKERLNLPSDINFLCNPKSSTGRIDVQVRVLADGLSRYDADSKGGYDGDLWMLISPKSFPILLSTDESLSQIRFIRGHARLSDPQLTEAQHQHTLLWDAHHTAIQPDGRISDRDGSLILTIDVTRDTVGWECLGTQRILDVSKRSHYAPQDFFTPLYRRNGSIRLKNNAFYILYTREYVSVPPHLACEMVPMDERSGEFRAHYAGFIDPGWGWGTHGEATGRRLVLEVRPFEDIVLRDEQPIGKIMFEQMIEEPMLAYDQIDSNYIADAQLPRLSKHFRTDTV